MNKTSSKFSAQEINTIHLNKNARFRIALIYPNSYCVGMSNLGLHTIYALLNSRLDCRCERFFFDPKISSARGAPVSVETASPLNAFDILAFSVSYELDYLNFFSILKSAGLFSLSAERPAMPLVIVGGMVNAINPRPLSRYSDALFCGEAEESLSEFMDTLSASENITSQEKKEKFLAQASRISGVYVPGFSPVPAPRLVSDINKFSAVSRIITPNSEFANTFLAEVSRGCPRSCNFCVTGAIFSKFRPRQLDRLTADIEIGRKYTPKIGLVGAAVSDYPQMEGLLAFLRQIKAKISVSSLRLESTNEDLLLALAQSGQQTVTFAPEAGSERLRVKLNKKITNDQVLSKIQLAQDCGLKKTKLYFMIGLPGETEEDLGAIASLALEAGRIMPVKLNISVFVPKPGTVFAEAGLADKKSLSQKAKMIRNKLSSNKNIQLNIGSFNEPALEYDLAHANEQFFSKFKF